MAWHLTLAEIMVLPRKYESTVKAVRRARLASLELVWETIELVKADDAITEEEKDEALANLFGLLGWADIRQELVLDASDYSIGTSFRGSLMHFRILQQHFGNNGVNFGGNHSKSADRTFAESLGLDTPRAYQVRVPLRELRLVPDCIVKPEGFSTSQGVFYVDGQLRPVSIRRQQTYSDLKEALTLEFSNDNRFLDAEWITEEAIWWNEGELAHDFKVFAFYGEVALVLEIKRQVYKRGRPEFCYYSPDGRILNIGDESRRFHGDGLPIGLLAQAESITREIPLPFVRVDFLCSQTHTYVGELTPLPGGVYAGRLTDELDRELGDRYLDSQARLVADVLRGKKFDSYFKVYSSLS